MSLMAIHRCDGLRFTTTLTTPHTHTHTHPTYRELEETSDKYIYTLFQQGVIDSKLRYHLQSTCSSLSVFYGLPKVHKNEYPIRPIISTIGSYQYQLSKYLARAIREARPRANSYVKDSFEFVKKIKDTILNGGFLSTSCAFR
jgi:hypothetical protein